MTGVPNHPNVSRRALLISLAINAIWINASEVFRYFVFVMGMMRDAHPGIDDVAPMSLPVFLIWGVWDTILLLFVTCFVWLWLDRMGGGIKNAVLAGTVFGGAIFGLLWIGIVNMNLAPVRVLFVALPFAILEQIIAALIIDWSRRRFGSTAGTSGIPHNSTSV